SPVLTPPSPRWGDFPLRGGPALAFALVAVLIAYSWKSNLAARTITSAVEARRRGGPGRVARRLVGLGGGRFAPGREGEPGATVVTTDPRIVEASLAVIRAEVELLKTGMDPVLNQHRDAVNYQQLRLAWLAQRVDLASARVRLQFADSELE